MVVKFLLRKIPINFSSSSPGHTYRWLRGPVLLTAFNMGAVGREACIWSFLQEYWTILQTSVFWRWTTVCFLFLTLFLFGICENTNISLQVKHQWHRYIHGEFSDHGYPKDALYPVTMADSSEYVNSKQSLLCGATNSTPKEMVEDLQNRFGGQRRPRPMFIYSLPGRTTTQVFERNINTCCWYIIYNFS